MSEVVVQISADESQDASRLTKALDAFAKWSAEAGLTAESGDAPDIMMMTEYSGGAMRRKLVFQSRDHAARFPHLAPELLRVRDRPVVELGVAVGVELALADPRAGELGDLRFFDRARGGLPEFFRRHG